MLIGALLATNTGLQAASTFLDVVSNNIANANTDGYKTGQVTFQDLLYAGEKPGAVNAQGNTVPVGIQLGNGVVVDGVTGLFTQGTLTPTGQQFDLAIDGQGFFAVTLLDGTTGYTRAGGLTLNANRQLVTPDGFLLAGGITVPADASSVSVATDGTVVANTPSGPQAIGQLTLTDFSNPAGLVRVGDTTFAAGPNAGTATTGAPGSGGLGIVRQGFLESSNVDLSTELVNLIVAQRAFQINAQALTVENQTLQATVALIP